VQLNENKKLNKYEKIMKFFFASEKVGKEFLRRFEQSNLESIGGISANLPRLN
jgi:hypothetical protein